MTQGSPRVPGGRGAEAGLLRSRWAPPGRDAAGRGSPTVSPPPARLRSERAVLPRFSSPAPDLSLLQGYFQTLEPASSRPGGRLAGRGGSAGP